MRKTVLVPIADSIEEIEAICIIDALRRAGAAVTVASVEDKLQITASRQVRLVADKFLHECANETFDLIALPGGMPGAERLRDNEQLTKMLKEQQQTGRLFAGICAAPKVILQHHNLLNTYKATAYPGFYDDFPIPDDTNSKVVVDKNCITSQGPGTALQFSIKLIELLFNKERAEQVAAAMLVGE
jgi:protein deglycase